MARRNINRNKDTEETKEKQELFIFDPSDLDGEITTYCADPELYHCEEFFRDRGTPDAPVFNYTLLYDTLFRCFPQPLPASVSALLPHPSKLRNGDGIQFFNYRGCGTYLVVHLDETAMPSNDTLLIDLFRSGLRDSCNHRTVSYPYPEANDTVSPATSGTGGSMHVYLFRVMDEYGYSLPTALSSARIGYTYENGGDRHIDPVLTLPNSDYGKIIAELKETDEWKGNPDFPLKYVGYESNDCFEGIEWTILENNPDEFYQLEFVLPTLKVREVFWNHLQARHQYILK